ncbi:hypothetical protein PG990_006053 [Apiospora arundinis]|uniref:F-box domain-containing protein n=1 Tax=Apiospora arundinis TaxID=335852 RepID=A0ABR2J9C8_9PEZI
MAALLLTMPLEVLLSISYYLPTVDYCNLRQSCKHIEASLHSSFAKEYFSKRQFILTEFSLQALVGISNSKFAPYLSHVILAAERPVWGRPHLTPTVDNTVEATRRLRMRQEYASHIGLISLSQDLELLAEAFGNLPNLQTIGMRDFNSRTRFRDHPQIEWRSYGANTYYQHTGLTLTKPDPRTFVHGPPQLNVDDWARYEARLFTGLLQALGKSGSKPKRVEVILRTVGLFDIAFNTPRFSEPFVGPVLAHLETLFLDLNEDQVPAMTTSGTNCSYYFLRVFLSKVPALSSLRLNFANSDHHKTCEFLSWLSSQPTNPIQGIDTDLSPPPVLLSSLRQLDLGKASISIDVLTDLVRKYNSLQGLSFYKVSLMGTGTGTNASSDPARVNLWAKALRHFIKLDVALTSIRIDSVLQDNPPSHQSLPVRFTGDSCSKTWRGKDKVIGLKDLANSIVINWPEDNSEVDSEDESMNDDEDSADEIDDDEDGDDDE